MRKRLTTEHDPSQPRTVRIYLRVSTEEQAGSGLGLEAQARRCRAYAEARGWDVVAVYTDAGVSAKTLDRSELRRALEDLRGGDVLIAFKIDRLTRTVADFPQLHEAVEAAGADLVTVEEQFDTSTAMGRAMLNMALTFSQLERELTGERTSAALHQKKIRGERLGTTPTGYRTHAGKLQVDEVEMRIVVRARELNDGSRSLRDIGEALRAAGFVGKRGGALGPSAVTKLLGARYVEQL